VIANGQDRAGWESTITKMAGFGAQGTDDEFTEILDYLTKNFPPASAPLNVNKATAAQIESGLALTTAEAEAVVKYREKNGDFKTIDDLKKVPDVDAKKLDAKKDHLAF
jgi:competence protein ComEA